VSAAVLYIHVHIYIQTNTHTYLPHPQQASVNVSMCVRKRVLLKENNQKTNRGMSRNGGGLGMCKYQSARCRRRCAFSRSPCRLPRAWKAPSPPNLLGSPAKSLPDTAYGHSSAYVGEDRDHPPSLRSPAKSLPDAHHARYAVSRSPGV
jgi:hypothetical protein